ncbi:hypothetical protein GALMADRAFT_146484 [Galerina marginata CBS 339.88]|uniref:HECT-type E3 ubiquitin transferase n=1 Tax=Galerina marginata (strain CBS 339.88) TaxID=685588 RepID=A0A067SBK3_GALM3|nr:hypothetical protein GALMADRAFT_146484 [Galerina marginata CBS 339.88]
MPRYYSDAYWFIRYNKDKQPEKAAKIQKWWRRMLEVRAARKPLRRIFESDVTGLTGLKCLVLIGGHKDVLGTWARAMMQLGPEAVLALASGEQSTSWLVLMRKAAFLLCLALAHSPESSNASSYLDILMILLSNEHAVTVSGVQGSAFCHGVTDYLMKKRFYRLLGKSISKLPIENSASLQRFLNLCTLPMSTYAENSPQFNEIYVDIFVCILGLPLLPNRLPPDNPSPFISYFLLANLDKLTPLTKSISRKASPDLVANLFLFVSPHYKGLSTAAFASYLELSTALINSYNGYAWYSSSQSETSSEAGSGTNPVDYDSDFSDGHSDYVDLELSKDGFPDPFEVTHQTLEWLEEIPATQHITNLINLTQLQASLLPHLVAYLFTVTATWPSYQQEIRHIVLANSRGGLVRDLYRELVWRSPLGQEENSMNVYSSALALHWRPLILLADLYSQALQTMDDHEFLGSASGSQVCNPLTLAEVASFSVQLLNIIFSLYWRYSDYCDENETQYIHISSDVYCSWSELREKLLRCLCRIYARERPFVFLGHWLLRSTLDMNTFIDFAVIQNQGSASTVREGPLTIYYFKTPREINEHPWTSMIRPRVSILKNIPFAIPFDVRVSIFQHLIVNDRVLHDSTERLNALGHDQRSRVKIRRSMLAQDGFDRLTEVDLKAPLEIVMIDQFGQEEEGIDGSGHFKEFFTLFSKQVLETHSGLWLKNQMGELYPTSWAYATEDHILDWYWFVGRMIGKAIYEGILIDVRFAYFFLSKWQGRRSYLDDLFSLDPDLYIRLLSLKHFTETVEDLSLYFTIATTEEPGVTKMVDLIPNGSEIAVTRENRLRYIDLAARYRLNAQIKRQTEAFLQGLSQLIQPKWLKMFNQRELQIIIGGANVPIDLDDLRRHTTYGGIYHNSHETIIAFWRVVNSFHRWQTHNLLRFVTSCSRPHVLGFKELSPNFSIRDDGPDENRLPSSRTCVNLLKLPTYKSERQLREMLLEAISARAGFDSS